MNVTATKRRPLRQSMRGALALALLGVSFIVLRPVCAVSELAGALALAATAVQAAGGAHEGPCCSSIDDTVPVAATKLAGLDSGAAHVAPSARSTFQIVFASRFSGSSRNAAPPRSLSYHARSARILS